MLLVGHNSSIELTPLWSVGKLLFLHNLYTIMCTHCLLPLLLVSVMKCYVSNCIALCLTTHIVVQFLHLYMLALTAHLYIYIP